MTLSLPAGALAPGAQTPAERKVSSYHFGIYPGGTINLKGTLTLWLGPERASLLAWPVLFLLEQFALRGRLGIRLPVVLVVLLLAWMGAANLLGEKDRCPL